MEICGTAKGAFRRQAQHSTWRQLATYRYKERRGGLERCSQKAKELGNLPMKVVAGRVGNYDGSRASLFLCI